MQFKIIFAVFLSGLNVIINSVFNPMPKDTLELIGFFIGGFIVLYIIFYIVEGVGKLIKKMVKKA